VVAVSERARGAAAVLAGALLLGVAWLVIAPGSPPLYDGVGFPDEPYRYLTPPAGAPATKPPTSASADITVTAGKSVAANISTREQGPQAAIYIADQGLAVQGSTGVVTVSLSPTPADTRPADGSIPGNAYTIAASSKGGSVAVSSIPSAVTVLLRVPKATSARVAIEVLVGDRWEQLNTFQTGSDVYSAALPVLGTVAAVLVTASQRAVPYAGAASGQPQSGGGLSLGPLLAGSVVLALVLLIVGIRLSRRRRAVAPGPATRSPPAAPPR
jgi:hypothetical protein